MNPFAVEYSWLIPLLPLLAAGLVALAGPRLLRGASHWPVWLGVGGSAVLSVLLLLWVTGPDKVAGVTKPLWTWFEAGTFKAEMSFWLDPLSVVMLCVVTCVGLLITIFSAGYMKGDRGYARFFAFLGLFIFAMTCLVMGDNFLLLFLGWEGVGLASYLLIGFYYETPVAREAARKAFIVNRIGDLGLVVGIMLIYKVFGTVTYFGGHGVLDQVTALLTNPAAWDALSAFDRTAITVIPFLLLVGACGKSAQFPLYTWLPDAMAGPTPVSALIHAATMVTAGVYLVVRCMPLFAGNIAALTTLGVIGCFTAILAGTIALRQFDLKKALAYSTVSQLGFMFVGAAALAPVASIYHLVTHAMFKALLFLGAGVVMHATHGELDMRRMSGLRKFLPLTRWLMLAGCLALAGFPGTAGFFSKDEILVAAWHHNPLLGGLMVLTAGLTAYYTFRLYYRVFEGPEVIPGTPGAADSARLAHGVFAAGDKHADHPADDHGGGHDDHAPREPIVMTGPLILLAMGALLGGILVLPALDLGKLLGRSPSLAMGYAVADTRIDDKELPPGAFGQAVELPKDAAEHEHALHLYMAIASGLVAVTGIGLARHFHGSNRPAFAAIEARTGAVNNVLEHKYWVDEIYDAIIVGPARGLAATLAFFDLVLGWAVWAINLVPQLGGFALKFATQTGRLGGYAVLMLGGVAVILVVIFL